MSWKQKLVVLFSAILLFWSIIFVGIFTLRN